MRGQKEEIRGGMEGEALNEGYFCKIPIIKQDTNFISQTVGHTNFSSQPLQSACPKTCKQGFCSEFEQFFLVKNNFVCVFLWDKYGFKIGKSMEKINSILTGKKCSKLLETPCI